MRQVNFNSIAFLYDFLAKAVFGNQLKVLQVSSLRVLKDSNHQNILILGGGTGWIIHEIRKGNAKIEITYIESSSRMIDYAQKVVKKYKYDGITFLLASDHLNIPEKEKYDVVITNFYLDVFPKEKLIEVIDHIDNHTGQLWILTDFFEPSKNNVLQKILLKMMFWFFKITTGLENENLCPYHQLIMKKGYQPIFRKAIKKGFIRTIVFQKN